MTINFRSKRPSVSDCAHQNQMRTEIAGMCRTVCEACGRVSLGYIDDHFKADGDPQRAIASAPRS